MRNLKKVIGFLVFMFLFVFAVPSVASAAEQQYTENLIPIMTSNTTPSGVAEDSSHYSTTPAWKAFDNNIYYLSGGTNSWGTTGISGWLSYEFPTPRNITKYTIHTNVYGNTINPFPRDWTFEAWDGAKWIILDTRSNVTDWTNGIKKEFIFNNVSLYSKYRINVTSNVSGTVTGTVNLIIGELEMMESLVSAPTDLVAVPGDKQIKLTWNAVDGALSYNIKRSTASGEETIQSVTGSSISFSDTGLINGTTYYYVVTAVRLDKESSNSNEVSAAPLALSSAILDIYMDNGTLKEYNLTGTELNDFITWYEARSTGSVKAFYTFSIKGTTAPFKVVKNYIPYDKILFFDVKEYSE